MSKQSLDETLEELVDLCNGNIWYDYKEGIKNPAIAEARAAIVEAVEGLIGPDEPVPEVANGGNIAKVLNRNAVKNQIRQAIKEWQ